MREFIHWYNSSISSWEMILSEESSTYSGGVLRSNRNHPLYRRHVKWSEYVQRNVSSMSFCLGLPLGLVSLSQLYLCLVLCLHGWLLCRLQESKWNGKKKNKPHNRIRTKVLIITDNGFAPNVINTVPRTHFSTHSNKKQCAMFKENVVLLLVLGVTRIWCNNMAHRHPSLQRMKASFYSTSWKPWLKVLFFSQNKTKWKAYFWSGDSLFLQTN